MVPLVQLTLPTTLLALPMVLLVQLFYHDLLMVPMEIPMVLAANKVSRVGLDLAVLFTPFIQNRQNTNQGHRNICAGVLQHTPSSEVV